MSSGAKMPTKSPHHTEEDFLEVDKPIPGQSFCCVSFVSPEKTLMNKEQHMFYHYHQYVLKEYSKIFGELTDKILESGEDEVNVSEVVDLKKRMGRIFNANEVKYDAWKEMVEDFKFRDGDKVDRVFDEMNNFETSVRGVKVRGVYDSYREAEVRAKVLQRMDNRFDVFVGQVGYWLPWHPDINKIENQEYLNEDLNTLMKEYKNNESKRDMFYQEQVRSRTQEAREQNERMKKELEAEKEAMNAESEKSGIEEVVEDSGLEGGSKSAEVEEVVDNLQDMDPWMKRKMEEQQASA